MKTVLKNGGMQMEDVQDPVAVATVATPVAVGYVEGVHQWRRYFARMLDNMLNVGVFLVLLMLALAFTLPEAFLAFAAWLESIHRIADLMLTVFLGTVLNAVLLGMTGSTLGKWLFGIRVREADGSHPGFARAFQREFHVWMRGMAFGIPLISLFTLIHAYNQLDNFRQTTWDRDMQLVVTHRPANAWQYILWTLVVIGCVGVMAFSLFAALSA